MQRKTSEDSMRLQKSLTKSSVFGISLAFIVLCLAIGGIEAITRVNPVFFTSPNLLNILLQTAINTIIAVGMTFIIITAGIDLSVGSLLALCNVIMGLTMLHFSPNNAVAQIFFGILAALGAIQAIGQAGKTGKIFVTSYDNLKAAQQAILADKLAATIEQHPELMGYEGVVTANDLIKGKTVSKEKLIRLDLITKEKLNDR